MSEDLVRLIASQTDPRWALGLARSAAGLDPEPSPLFVTVVAPAHLARALATLRERHGWSIRAMAAEAGVSSATLHRAERGHNVDATTLVALTSFIRKWWWQEGPS